MLEEVQGKEFLQMWLCAKGEGRRMLDEATVKGTSKDDALREIIVADAAVRLWEMEGF